MAKRGRPKGAQSGPRLTTAWCAWGTPHHLDEHGYSTEGGARNKALTELQKMRNFGDKFSHSFRDQIDVIRREVNDCAFSGATVDSPRQWTAVDDVSNLHFTVQLWTGTFGRKNRTTT